MTQSVLNTDFSDTQKPTIKSTLKLMIELHQGVKQTDHSGRPYEYHPMRVMLNLRKFFPNASDDVIMAALLHDVVEDCFVTREFLESRGYSKNCIDMIFLVTKPENDTRSYDEVITDLIASGNVGAMMIKIADNADNLHPERARELAQTKPEKAAWFNKKYNGSIVRLCDAIGEDSKRILNFIETDSPRITGKATLQAVFN